MDFLNELLPLLIVGAIYLVGHIAGKKKKAAAKQAPRPANAEARDVLVPTKSAVAKKGQKKKQPAAKKETSPFLNYDLMQNAGQSYNNEPILIEEEEVQSQLLTDFQDTEEIRKAIMYSEILNRKF